MWRLQPFGSQNEPKESLAHGRVWSKRAPGNFPWGKGNWCWRKLRLGQRQTFLSCSNKFPFLCTQRRGRKLLLNVRRVNCEVFFSDGYQRKGNLNGRHSVSLVITRKRAVTAPSLGAVQTFLWEWRRKKREMLSEGTVMMKRGLEGVMWGASRVSRWSEGHGTVRRKRSSLEGSVFMLLEESYPYLP